LPERTVNLKIEEAYAKLKTVLTAKGCAVASETESTGLVVKQGSLWGISPITAKKTINFNLKAAGEKTNITFSSKLASDWKNITIIGCILALVLTAVCVWMATDLSAFMVDGNPGFWSWIITTGDTVKFAAGETFVNLALGLAVFLCVVVALEIGIYFNAKAKIVLFVEEILKGLV
jgi:hypothetical protein